MENSIAQTLLQEEIRRVVADAILDGRIVKAGRHASNLLQAYPGCGLSVDQIVNEIGAAAACAGIPVELSRPE